MSSTTPTLEWLDVFTELSRRKLGQVAKTVTRAEQIEWAGYINGVYIHITSTIRSGINRSQAHFLTSSNARLHLNIDFHNYVELQLRPENLPDSTVRFIYQMATAADTRSVVLLPPYGHLIHESPSLPDHRQHNSDDSEECRHGAN